MKIRDKILMQKCYVIVFNGIFLALGLMLLIFGLWLLFDRSNFFTVLFSSGKNQLVPYISCILLGIGSAITFTSALGFLGSVLEIKRLLVTYMSFQILVFVTQMAILVLIFVKKEEEATINTNIAVVTSNCTVLTLYSVAFFSTYSNSNSSSNPHSIIRKVHNQWNNRIDEVVSEYGNESLAEQEPVWNILNAMQHKMECCGRYNVTQWERNKNKENSTQIPCSCTKSGLKKWFCDVSRDSTYSVGCEEHLRTWFENNVLILTAVSISLLITQILLITSTGQLLRNIRKNNIWPNES